MIYLEHYSCTVNIHVSIRYPVLLVVRNIVIVPVHLSMCPCSCPYHCTCHCPITVHVSIPVIIHVPIHYPVLLFVLNILTPGNIPHSQTT